MRSAVSDAPDSLRDEKVVETDRDGPRVFHHVDDQLSHKGAKMLVDGLVIANDLCGCNGIEPCKCIECPAKDIRGHVAGQLDFCDIDGPCSTILGNAAHPLRYLSG